MTPEPACIIDVGRPCHACSAAGPLACPYRYLLGWDDESLPQHTAEPQSVARGASRAVPYRQLLVVSGRCSR